MYVQTGTRIYTIADLSRVWVMLDAYESDLPWLRYGQAVEFTTESYPGQVFAGTIAFIDPVLDDQRRTVKVRVNVPNEDGRLKPGMFVRGAVRAVVAGSGNVVAPDLAGKWISPMHPEIVKDRPGNCDVCGMPLVKAEALGFVSPDDVQVGKPLVVPASAVLLTGKRAIVYVKVPDRPQPTFEGRQIVLGPRAGDFYLVGSNLREGELVVTAGNFKIDSALQLSGKPSMMTGTTARPQPVPPQFTRQLGAVLEGYFPVVDALAADDHRRATEAAGRLRAALDEVDGDLLETQTKWTGIEAEMRSSLEAMSAATDLEAARKALALLSEELASAVRHFGGRLERPVYRVKCPMAFGNRGATWLQSQPRVTNPYFGRTMLRCGATVETFAPGDQDEAMGHVHD
jgi:Cu(I)/Ag(I) efflux system membrane fusion protein